MACVDLNCDLGESYGVYTIGTDAEVLRVVTSANVACGWHAGDPSVMERTVALAKEAGVAVGCHPGYPDLPGFGRRDMALSPEEARVCVKYQIGALMAFTKAAGMSLQHVKLHGAFYNRAAADPALARAVCRGIAEVDEGLIVLALANSHMIGAAREAGLRAASEVFADRAYHEDGALVSRAAEGSILHDRALAVRRAVRMVKEGVVECVTGKDVPIRADSICVHGDNPEALGFVRHIREAFEQEGIALRNLSVVCGG